MSYEMTTSVRFCLSYDPLNGILLPSKMSIFPARKRIVDTDIVSDVTCTLHVWPYDFYETTLSTE